MVCLGLEPRAADGRLRRIHWAMVTPGFLLKVLFFKKPTKSPNFWAPFVTIFVIKNFKKSPNMVTLLVAWVRSEAFEALATYFRLKI